MESPLGSSWTEFNTALTGAIAAFGGLLIVAMSVNIKQISESRTLAARAGASIAVLVVGLVAACLSLVPGQSLRLLGAEVLVATAAASLIAARSTLVLAHDREMDHRSWRISSSSLFLLPILTFAIGSVLMTFGLSGGYFVVAAAMVLALVTAAAFSWVALIEILR